MPHFEVKTKWEREERERGSRREKAWEGPRAFAARRMERRHEIEIETARKRERVAQRAKRAALKSEEGRGKRGALAVALPGKKKSGKQI